MRCITMMGLLGGILMSAGFTPVRAQTLGGAPSFTPSHPATIQLVAHKSRADADTTRRFDLSREDQGRLLDGVAHDEFDRDGLDRTASFSTRDLFGRTFWLTLRPVPGPSPVVRIEAF